MNTKLDTKRASALGEINKKIKGSNTISHTVELRHIEKKIYV